MRHACVFVALCLIATGVFLAEWLGRQIYSIGMTAYEGSEGMAVGGPVSSIAPAREGTLEAQLHTLGFPYAFVDLRTLRKPLDARFPKFETVRVEAQLGPAISSNWPSAAPWRSAARKRVAWLVRSPGSV